MVHLGCLSSVSKGKKDEIFQDAVKTIGTFDIMLEAPLHIGFPVVPCCLCNVEGKEK